MNEDEILIEPSLETDDESHKALNNLRIAIQSPSLLNYAENLEKDANKEGINVAVVDSSELEREEAILEHERILGLNSLAKVHHDLQLKMLANEQDARKKLQKQYSKQLKTYQSLKDNSTHSHQLQQVFVTKTFRKNELKVKTAMKKKNAEIDIKLEKNEDDQLLYGGINRIYQISWRGRPQVVEIRIDECRDIKDKLERGEYWIRIHTKEKIGGKILEYQKCPESMANVSEPYYHEGRYTNKVIKFQSTLRVLVPSRMDITPPMVYCFQILDHNSVIVGEGYFPIVDNLFAVTEGKFKVPLLRSSLKSSVDKFAGIEELYRTNIDEWLCNLYFQSTLLPQVITGEAEYRIQLHSTKVLQEEVNTEAEARVYDELITPDQYSEYKYSVAKSGVLITPKNKLHYIKAEIVLELGFKTFRHWQIYFSLLLLIAQIWLGRYIHFTGQWLFLKGAQFPITTFQSLIFTLEIRFPSNTDVGKEAGILLMGPAFMCFWFGIMILMAWTSLYWVGRFPEMMFRFIQCWGLVTIIDPLVTLVEAGIWGAVYGYWEIDPFRLYNYFETAEGNGVVGILLTVFLYAGMMGFCGFVFYNYFLFIHMNGRLLDIYMRLNGPESRFFIPHDGEVSKRYLEWVCFKARNYRSINGDSRKIAVMNYTISDGFSNLHTKGAMHIIVYTVANDMSRAVYRQFLRLTDGAISELSLVEASRRRKYTQRFTWGPERADTNSDRFLSPTDFLSPANARSPNVGLSPRGNLE